jgi:hypothetical protein
MHCILPPYWLCTGPCHVVPGIERFENGHSFARSGERLERRLYYQIFLVGSVYKRLYRQSPELSNILLNQEVASLVKSVEDNTRSLIAFAAKSGAPAAALMASLAYFDAYRSERMPTNLIQAQRDYFGAHTYQRTDIPGTFHTEWGQQ